LSIACLVITSPSRAEKVLGRRFLLGPRGPSLLHALIDRAHDRKQVALASVETMISAIRNAVTRVYVFGGPSLGPVMGDSVARAA
jgi:hypothetical protein